MPVGRGGPPHKAGSGGLTCNPAQVILEPAYDWDGHDFRDMAAGVLGFTRAQASAIRARASASSGGTSGREP